MMDSEIPAAQMRLNVLMQLENKDANPINADIQALTENKYDGLIKEIANMIWVLLPMPFTDLTQLDTWQSSRFAPITEDNNIFKLAEKKMENLLQRTVLLDFFDHLRESNPSFNINADYMSREKSARVIREWLQFQFGENWINVLETIYKVCKYIGRPYMDFLTNIFILIFAGAYNEQW